MNNLDKFNNVFKNTKPIIGMIHLKGTYEIEIIGRAIAEIDTMIEKGVDAVLIENYHNSHTYVKIILQYLYKNRNDIIYGVNILGDHCLAFELANTYNAKFIQIDSVAGHLSPYKDAMFRGGLSILRRNSKALVLGGVRFKYQPVVSTDGLEVDLQRGMDRCDAVVVTGKGTAIETGLSKIQKFKSIIKEFPLVVGAGLTANNCYRQLEIADGGIVGSYFKNNYRDDGEIAIDHIEDFMGQVKRLRK